MPDDDFPIEPSTKVAALLGRSPELEDIQIDMAPPPIALLNTWVPTQTYSTDLDPYRSTTRPRNGITSADANRAMECTPERVARSHPVSSMIGLNSRLKAVALMKKTITHEAATVYQQ